ncbi:MAG TPA: hypothetical protein VE439_05965 [Anaerolineae bacterium]|nr:hypothetical protein [Anaerolineae bacterium]
MLTLLLKLRIKVLWNSISTGTPSQMISLMLSLLFALILIGTSFSTGLGLFAFIYKTGGSASILSIVSTFFLTFFALIMLSSIATAFYAMINSPDLPIWLTAPVSLRVIFLEKFVEVFIGSSVWYVILLLPALLALGFVLGPNIFYFLILPPISILFIAIPAGFGMVLTMLIVRFIKVERIREVFGAIGAVFGLGIYLGSQFLVSRSGQNVIKDASSVKVLQGARSFFSPTTWPPEILVRAGIGDYYGMLLPTILLLGSSIAVFILALLVTEKAYFTGLTRISDLSSKKKRVRTISEPNSAVPASGPIRTIVIKDLKCLYRDMQEWIQFLSPVAFIFVVLFQARRDGFEGMANALFIAVLLMLIMSAVAGRLSLTGVGRERRSIWVIHQAPVERLKIVVAKVLVAYLPSLVLAELLYVIIGLINGLPIEMIIVGLMVVAGILLGISALGAMFGSINPKFDAANPRELIQGVGGFTYLASSMMYLAVTLGVFALPQLGRLIHINPVLLWGVSVVVLYVVVAISTYAFVAAATKSLEAMEVTV